MDQFNSEKNELFHGRFLKKMPNFMENPWRDFEKFTEISQGAI